MVWETHAMDGQVLLPTSGEYERPNMSRLAHVKVICPTANKMPVTLSSGFQMPSCPCWILQARRTRLVSRKPPNLSISLSRRSWRLGFILNQILHRLMEIVIQLFHTSGASWLHNYSEKSFQIMNLNHTRYCCKHFMKRVVCFHD